MNVAWKCSQQKYQLDDKPKEIWMILSEYLLHELHSLQYYLGFKHKQKYNGLAHSWSE